MDNQKPEDKLETYIAPIVRGKFSSPDGKMFDIADPSVQGWYLVTTDGDVIEISDPDMIAMHEYKPSLGRTIGYTCGNWMVPRSFQQAQDVHGLTESSHILMNEAPGWQIVECVVWGKERAIIFDRMIPGPDFDVMVEMKGRLDEGRGIADMKDLPLELRYLYILQFLAEKNQMYSAKVSDIENKKKAEESTKAYEDLVGERIKDAVEGVGGFLVTLHGSNGNLVVDWKIGKVEYRSLIDRAFSSSELGYCIPAEGRRGSMDGTVQFLRDFNEAGLIYKRRGVK